MKRIYGKPQALKDVRLSYCPGCGHGIIHKLIAQCIDELGIRDDTIVVAPVGCSVFLYEYFDCDGTESSHGRAQAVATGLKRALTDKVIIAYQGDGDLAAIGTAETLHAANRGENFTTIYVNNAIYGMTGGQMAPTTLSGQRTATSPFGRETAQTGYPLKIGELLSRLEATAYIERVSVHDVKHILKAKRAIRKGIEYQMKGLGYSLVEVLAMCPTNWGMSPPDAAKWVEDTMMEYYPLGVIKDKGAAGKDEDESDGGNGGKVKERKGASGEKVTAVAMRAGRAPAGKKK
jgi:2-oxoglutarate ferredoxin oxidoreductase subunit beta